jgi:hypothetical protein
MIYDGLVFYSSFFPDEKNIFRGEKFLTTMVEKFKNHLIFVGIQTDTINTWLEILEKYKNSGLNIIYERCNPELYVNSDVAGYQKALELFYLNKENIKVKDNSLAWFGHSKGVTTNEMSCHNWMFENFWGKPELIMEKLFSNNSYGCYGTHLSFLPIYDTKKIKDIWTSYCDFTFIKKPIKFMYVNTFFVIKSEIFLKMINNLSKKFLYKKINGVHGGEGDRYFFERDFIHFVDMMGYEPIFETYGPNVTWGEVNPDEYYKHLNE